MSATTTKPIGHYTADQIARLAGVSTSRIGAWAALGLVPSVRQNPNVYSYADAGEAILVHYLVDQGRRPGEVRDIVVALRGRYGRWPLSNAPLENDGALVVVREGENLHFVPQTDQRVISGTLINLRTVREALRHGGWVAIDAPRPLIRVDPTRHSGAPTLAGRRIPTSLVVDLAEDEDGREALREGYALTEEEVAAAISYERAVEEAIAA